MTGPQPTPPPVTLASIQWDWGSAYTIGYGGDQWLAARRDSAGAITADTLTGLETAIQADYRHRPVSRDFDPPPGGTGAEDEDEDGHAPGTDESFLLTALREAFPAWVIRYNIGSRTWTARTRKKTISQPTSVLLCAALVLADRRARRQAGGWK